MAPFHLTQEALHSIRQWLAESGLEPGVRLPSERKLAGLLGLKHTTANRAVGLLIEEGVIVREGYKLTIARGIKAKPVGEVRTTFDVVLYAKASLIRDFRRTAREIGVGVRVHEWETNDEFVDVLHGLDPGQITGLLIKPPFNSAPSGWEDAIGRLTDQGVPCVTFSQSIRDLPSVVGETSLALEKVFDHLGRLGHRDLALILLPETAPGSQEMVRHWKLQCCRPGFGGSSERVLHQRNMLEEKARELVGSLKKKWKSVTAIVFLDHYLAGPLISRLKKAGIRVPEDLSIVSIGDCLDFRELEPSVSCISFPEDAIVETGFRLLQRSVRKKEQTGKILLGERLGLQPTWVERQSVSKCPLAYPGTAEAVVPPAWNGPPQLNLDADPRLRQAQVAKILNSGYPFLGRNLGAPIRKLDLTPYFNRPLQFRRGWLGDRPLSNLSPGEHRFHSVPFQVGGGAAQSDCGAIVFRSCHNAIGRCGALPAVIRIPVGIPTLAIYFLHGCGWAEYMLPVASYTIHGRGGIFGEIPLISLGQPPSDITSAIWKKDCQKANIQDWWPEFPHVNFPTARRVPILRHDHQPSLRYLYTLEWINPRPGEMVESIEVSANARQSATLGLLAVSVLASSL